MELLKCKCSSYQKLFLSRLLQVVPSAFGISLVRINIFGVAFIPEFLIEVNISSSSALLDQEHIPPVPRYPVFQELPVVQNIREVKQ